MTEIFHLDVLGQVKKRMPSDAMHNTVKISYVDKV